MSGTYISKIPILVVALVIGIVLVTSAVVPLASDYSEAKTFTNEGYFKMTKYDTSTDLNASWDPDSPDVFTVNNVDIPIGDIDVTQARTIMASEEWCLRLGGHDPTSNTMMQFFIGSSNVPVGGTNGGVTITASNGSITVTNEASTPATRTGSYTNIYCISDDGDYTMKKSDKTAYMNGDSFFMGVGLTAGSSAIGIVGVNMSGDIENGATINVWRGTDITISNISIVKTTDSKYLDLYNLDKVTFTATDAESDSLDITYSYFIIPTEVTADPDNPVAYKNLVKVVPLMAFIMLVVAAAGMIYLKNKD